MLVERLSRSDPTIHSILATLEAGAAARQHLSAVCQSKPDSAPVLPFVTISRQAGTGGLSIARTLVECLSQTAAGEPNWTCWDRDVVERVAGTDPVSQNVIDSLEEADHSWLDDFVAGLATVAGPSDESVLFQHVATTVRALARAGRVVIVGCGGVLLTRSLPGGMHVRIVAPESYRVENLARLLNVTPKVAAAEVQWRDHNREKFFRRFFHKHALIPETFTVTLNAAAMEESEMVNVLAEMVLRRLPVSSDVPREIKI